MKKLPQRLMSLLLIILLSTPASLAASSGPASGSELYDYFAAEELLDIYGNTFDSSVMLERPSIVNVWATWCGPCVEEIPALAGISAEFAGQVNVIGVQLDAVFEDLSPDEGAVAAARDLFGANATAYPSLIPSAAVMDYINTIGVEAIPTTWFVDAGGRVMKETVGSNDLAGWREEIAAFLLENPSAGEGQQAETPDSSSPPEKAFGLPFAVSQGEGALNNLAMGGSAISDGQYVYFSGTDDSIFRMNLEGTGMRKIATDYYMHGFTVKNGWIYYSYYDGQGRIGKVDSEGNNKQLIKTFETAMASELMVSDDGTLYYIKYLHDTGEGGYNMPRLFRIQPDGTGEEKISDFEAWSMHFDGEWIYATDSSGQLGRIDPNTGEPRQIDGKISLENGFELTLGGQMNPNSFDDAKREIASFNVADNTVYYTYTNGGSIHWIQDGVKESYDLGNYSSCYVGSIAGGWVFIHAYEKGSAGNYDDAHLYMLNESGDQVQCVRYR